MDVRITKPVVKLKLKEPVTLDELYRLMTESQSVVFPRTFKLKGGLLGKSIQFDLYLQVQPTITVKENTVTLRKIGKSAQVGGIDFKAMGQTIQAMADGDVFANGTDYFVNVCDRLQELLADRLQ